MVNVSTGLEPYFAFKYFRSGRLGKFIEVNAPIVQEYLKNNPEVDADNLPKEFVSAMELTPMEHVGVQNAIQYWVDSSISKTVNAPEGFTVNQVTEVYEALYKGGAKGGTVYVNNSRNTQVLTLGNDEKKKEKKSSKGNVDKIKNVNKHNQYKQKETETTTDDVKYGVEVGNTCPVCRQGVVEEIGGCNTCTNCKAQLTCGI